MIKIENFEVLGWEHAIRGLRNPMNSWDKSDSIKCDGAGCYFEDCPQWKGDFDCDGGMGEFVVGTNDLDLMTRLRNAGTDHRKFMRMLTVYVDLTAPLYWWKEFDTYKVGTVANSCSTMHKIHAKEFTQDDFSHEHMTSKAKAALRNVVNVLNLYREQFLRSKDKKDWWQMIQLLPSSYNQKRTVMLNYEVLANIYKSRKDHRLDEWHDLCHWIESLPYSQLITGN